MKAFEIDMENPYWLGDAEDVPEDLCLHGNATVRIGEEVFSDDCTVSATALYLLKSLERDHILDREIQMLPCCGFSYFPDKDWSEVIIAGCPNGIDWSVEHVPGGVKLTTESGAETFVPMEQYREAVFSFADKVESYYARCQPKKPFDDFDEKGYAAFWNEWHRRRNA